MLKKIKEDKRIVNLFKIILIIFLLSIFACYPYINKLPLFAHDLSYHLNRIENIVQGIRVGEFPVLIHAELLNGLGYANSLFYPEMFLYIPAVMVLLGISVMTSYKIFIWIITFFTFITMYVTTKKITKSKIISMISCILYTLSLYRFTDIYIRAAVGEILAFLFMPLVLYGIYDILYDRGDKWWILIVGIFGVVNSHIISLVMCLEIIGFLILINIKKIFTNKNIIKKLILTGVISILICSSVLFPLLEQLRGGNYKISEIKENPGQSLQDLALTPTQALKSELIFGWAASDSTNMDDLMTLGIGIILYILPLFLLFSKDKDESNKKVIIPLLILGVITIILTTKIFPWRYFGIMSSIQYPWRFNLVATLVLSIVSAYAVYHFFDNNKKEMCFIITLIVVCMASLQLDNVDINIVGGTYDYLINWAPTANGEYLPIGFDKESEYNTKVIDLNNNIEYEYERNGSKLTFYYINTESNEKIYINIPLIYYKGYIAYIENEQEKEYLNASVGENGLISIEINNIKEGTVTVEYQMTKIQKVGYIITGLCILVIVIIIIRKKHSNNPTKIKK